MFGSGITTITNLGKKADVNVMVLIGIELTVTIGTMMFMGHLSRKMSRLENKITENKKNSAIRYTPEDQGVVNTLINVLPCGCADKHESKHRCGKKMDPEYIDVEMDFAIGSNEDSNHSNHICDHTCDHVRKQCNTMGPGIRDDPLVFDDCTNCCELIKEIEGLRRDLGSELKDVKKKVHKTKKEVGFMYDVLKTVIKSE